MKVPHNEEASTVNVVHSIHDTEEPEVVNLAPSELHRNALADNFQVAGTHEPRKPYTICTGFWVFTKDKTLARSSITIW